MQKLYEHVRVADEPDFVHFGDANDGLVSCDTELFYYQHPALYSAAERTRESVSSQRS